MGLAEAGGARLIPGIIQVVKVEPIPRAKDQTPKEDPFYPEAVRRAKMEVRRLQKAGIIDSDGRRVRQDLPPDMREDQNRDFGG